MSLRPGGGPAAAAAPRPFRDPSEASPSCRRESKFLSFRLFSELFETVVVRNDSTLLVGETTAGDDGDGAGDLTLQLTVEQSTSHDVDVDALTDDLNAIVRRFTDAVDPRQETSA